MKHSPFVVLLVLLLMIGIGTVTCTIYCAVASMAFAQNRVAKYIMSHHCEVVFSSSKWQKIPSTNGHLIDFPPYKAYECPAVGGPVFILDIEAQP
jgi:hypothetical protein